MSKSVDELFKQYKGITPHGKNVRINFHYNGVRCFETIEVKTITKTRLDAIAGKRALVLDEIANNTFNYAKHFPNSNNAKKFGFVVSVPTVSDAFKKWFSSYVIKVRAKQAKTTLTRVETYILPHFGNRKLDNILRSEFINWRDLTLAPLLSNKTINDVFSPLRGIYASAMADRVIDFNPLDHIKSLTRVKPDEPDPFTMNEISIISKTETTSISEKNGILFAIYTGVRISEWMALSWQDVDFKNRQVRIRRAIVDGEYGYPKNDSSYRTIDLLDQAYEILLKQREITLSSPDFTISVLKSDNRTRETQTHQFVFLNSNSKEPFNRSSNFAIGFFHHFLNECEVRYRPPNQARHTYASQLLTKGVAERWIAKQMGHSSITMLEKHYGKWMKSEIPDMALQASKHFKIDPK